MSKIYAYFLDAEHRGMGGINSLNEDLLNSELSGRFEFRRSGLDELLASSKAAAAMETSVVFIFDEVLTWGKIPKIWRLRRRLNRWATNHGGSFCFIHREHHYSEGFSSHCVRAPRRFCLMLKLGYAMMDSVVAISAAQARWMKASKLAPAGKIRFFQQSINVGQFLQAKTPADPTSNHVDEDPEEGANPFVFGVIGRLTPQKGVDLLISAWGCFSGRRDVQLLVAGDGADMDCLRRQALPHGNIRFLGRVLDRKAFYERCDCIVLPSRFEPFGQVCLEARAAGRPVIVSSSDGLPEQIVSGCGLVFPDGDVGGLSRALLNLVELRTADKEAFNEMSRNARLSAETAWEAFLSEMSQLLEESAKKL